MFVRVFLYDATENPNELLANPVWTKNNLKLMYNLKSPNQIE